MESNCVCIVSISHNLHTVCNVTFDPARSLLKLHRTQKRIVDGALVPDNPDDSEDCEDSVDVTPRQGLVFVLIMSVFLVSLYYFYKYLGESRR